MASKRLRDRDKDNLIVPKTGHYGDQTTADVKLRLIYPDGSEYDNNPLYLHSQLLKEKSEFFQALLSERWSSNQNSHHLTISNGNKADNYVRCFQLLYASKDVSHLLFVNASEALSTLRVASEWLLKDAMDACMQYLEAVPWTNQESVEIRNLLSTLQINPSPNLTARLGTSESDYLSIMEANLRELLSGISSGGKYGGHLKVVFDMTLKIITANFREDSSQRVKEMTRALLLHETETLLENWTFKSHLDSEELFKPLDHWATVLAWFLHILRDMGVVEYVDKFARAGSVLFLNDDIIKIASQISFTKGFLDILDCTLKDVGSGKMVLPREVRYYLAKNWLKIVQCVDWNVVESNDKLFSSLAEGLLTTIQSLPLDDQLQFSIIWTRSFEFVENNPHMAEAFTLWNEKLRQDCNYLSLG